VEASGVELERGGDAVEAGVETSDAGVDDGVAPCNGLLGVGEETHVDEKGVVAGLKKLS
jgi:hypothetical protein